MAWNSRWANHIEDGPVNKAIALYHQKRPERIQDCATPSSLTECPRVVWLRYVKKVPAPLPMGWGKAQRMLHGRVFEDTIAGQLRESGNLLWHWRDGEDGDATKFEMGEGETRICGTPDLLLNLNGKVAISDAKTSMGKSFGYIPLTAQEAFKDYYWFKYQLQVEAYYLLCHKNKDWFEEPFIGEGKFKESISGESLPLPEVCHLFSYALDDGVVRREFTWTPTQESISKVLYYTRRWNRAYASKTMPDCTCQDFDGNPMKFCYFSTRQETTKTGAKIGVECCNINYKEKV